MGKIDFFKYLSKNALKTFGDMVKAHKSKSSNNNVMIKTARELFAKMIVVAQH